MGSCCQFQHRLRLTVDAVLLMADTLVLGPDPLAHVVIPELKQPIVLFRQKNGLGVRHAGALTVNGLSVRERANLDPVATITGEDFSLALEPVAKRI
jgi:hypothetical protein